MDALLKARKRPYNKTYNVGGRLVGDKAYLVNIDEFLRFFKGYNIKASATFAGLHYQVQQNKFSN